MSLSARIEQVLRDEHATLRRRIEEAEAALKELERGDREWTYAERVQSTPEPAERSSTRGNQRATPEPAEPAHLHSTAPLRRVWNPAREALIEHLDSEAGTVLRMGLQVARGREEFRRDLITPISSMLAEHSELKRQVDRVRTEARFVHAVRGEFTVMASAFEDHMRVEEVEIYPALLGDRIDINETGPVNVRRSADDVARSLRTSASLNRVQSQEPTTLMGRFKAWLQGE